MAGMEIAGDELNEIIERVDYLKKGRINYTTFLTATINLKEKLSDHLLFETFSRFDVQKTGYISEENLCEALKRYNLEAKEKEIKAMINEYDFARTGKIDYE